MQSVHFVGKYTHALGLALRVQISNIYMNKHTYYLPKFNECSFMQLLIAANIYSLSANGINIVYLFLWLVDSPPRHDLCFSHSFQDLWYHSCNNVGNIIARERNNTPHNSTKHVVWATKIYNSAAIRASHITSHYTSRRIAVNVLYCVRVYQMRAM